MDVVNSSTHLVEENKKPSYLTQYLGAFSACMGALSFGIALGYTSPASAMLTATNETRNNTDELFLTDSELNLFSSSVNIGAFVGGPIGGFLIGNIGRRGSMLLSVVAFVSSWLLTIFGVNFAMLITSRIIVGLATGITCIAANAYVGELSSVDIRGTLGSGFQLMVVIGIEYAYIFGAIVDSWQVLAIICIVPPVIYFILMFISKESPVYLLSKGDEKEAEASLQYFRGKDYYVEKELTAMKIALEESKNNKSSSTDLFTTYLVKPMTIALALMFFQQFSGVNAVLFNLTSIFEQADVGISPDLSSIIVGLVQVLATVVASVFVDRAGRKMLLILSSSIMAVSLVALGVFFYLQEQGNADSLGWLPLLSLIVFISAFSIGYGPIPWVMMSELFPSSVVGTASSLATMMNWSMSFVCTLIFKPLTNSIHEYGVYWMFAAICIMNLAFCVLLVPETKGKTSEEICAYFGAPTQDRTSTEEKKPKFDISTIS